MKTHTVDSFLKWAQSHGIGFNPQYPKSSSLIFTSAPPLSRFWLIPREPERRPYFLETILRAIKPWSSAFVWRLGGWPSPPEKDAMNEAVEYQILEGLNLPMGKSDVVEFDLQDKGKLLTMLFSSTVFAWSSPDDCYVVPNHGQCFLKLSHHDVIHITCRDPKDLEQIIATMDEEKFPLPKEVPDGTFKVPDWMVEK